VSHFIGGMSGEDEVDEKAEDEEAVLLKAVLDEMVEEVAIMFWLRELKEVVNVAEVDLLNC